MREIKEASASGDLLEVFGSGTAACICRECRSYKNKKAVTHFDSFTAVKAITIDDESIVSPKYPQGVFSAEMYRQITSRQWGIIPDEEWTTTCA